MSEEKLYAVKNNEGKYWNFEDQDGFWELSTVLLAAFTDEESAKSLAHDHGGHVVSLIEEPEKVVLTKEQAEIVEETHDSNYPASYIAGSSDDEKLIMKAYVNGYTVAKEKKYYVKVFKDDFGYLNINHVIGRVTASDIEKVSGYQTQFTKSEIEQLKQCDDIPLDWDKVKLIEVDDSESN